LLKKQASIYIPMDEDNYYIDRILQGDINAFTTLVDRHKRMVYTFTLKMVKMPEDAEEIAHDAFVKAYQSLGSFKKESKFSTWLYRIAFNECVSHLRKKKLETISIDEPRFSHLEAAEAENFIKKLNDKEQKVILMKALDKLPDDERSIITLFYLQECSIKEIVEITAYSESNVKIKLFRARKRLWEMLKFAFNDKKVQEYEPK
jgi:RNA polymerase sigma factor (sigma-70 family)